MIKGSICKKNRIMSVMPNLSKTDSLGLQLVWSQIHQYLTFWERDSKINFSYK